MIERVLEQSQQHLNAGFLSTVMLEDRFMITGLGTNKVLKALREHGYLGMKNAAKVERNNWAKDGWR
jgi:hypothetical protein